MCRVRVGRDEASPGHSRSLKVRVLNPNRVPNFNLALRPSQEDLSTDPINHLPKAIIPVSG